MEIEKTYLFNPFRIHELKNSQLQEMYQNVYNKLLDEPNTMYEYSHNIEVYSNLMYICGECIARFTKEIIEIKTKIQIDTAINQTNERSNWDTEKFGKAPAISYFEALATRMSKEDIKLLANKECLLKRFRNAYETLETKCNALKKKMESIKYEEFNQQ